MCKNGIGNEEIPILKNGLKEMREQMENFPKIQSQVRRDYAWKRMSVLATLLAASLMLLTACGLKEDAEPYSAGEAMQKIAEYGWVDETYEIVGTQHEDTRPKRIIYFCQSMERTLSFTITAGVYEEFYYNMSLGWKRNVGTDYSNEILSLYRDEAREIARSSPYYSDQESTDGSGAVTGDGVYMFCADSAALLPEIARVICAVNEIYLPEAKYHDGTEWSTYTDTVRILRQLKDGTEVYVDTVLLDGVNGTKLDEDALLTELQAAYEET